MINNIEVIEEINEKIKKNPGPSGYLHPCNKERLGDMKKLKFENGNHFTRWMQQNGIMRNPRDIDNQYMKKWYEDKGFKNRQEYEDHIAHNLGFRNEYERNYEKLKSNNIKYEEKKQINRDWHYKNGSLPMNENKDSAQYLGIIAAERIVARHILPVKFGGIEKEMPYGNPGFDFIVVGGYKIDIKATTLNILKKLSFHTRWNRITDYFLMIGFDDRERLSVIGIWLFKKDEKLRSLELYKRETFTMKFEPKYMVPFNSYELTDIWKNLNIDIYQEILRRHYEPR